MPEDSSFRVSLPSVCATTPRAFSICSALWVMQLTDDVRVTQGRAPHDSQQLRPDSRNAGKPGIVLSRLVIRSVLEALPDVRQLVIRRELRRKSRIELGMSRTTRNAFLEREAHIEGARTGRS